MNDAPWVSRPAENLYFVSMVLGPTNDVRQPSASRLAFHYNFGSTWATLGDLSLPDRVPGHHALNPHDIFPRPVTLRLSSLTPPTMADLLCMLKYCLQRR